YITDRRTPTISAVHRAPRRHSARPLPIGAFLPPQVSLVPGPDIARDPAVNRNRHVRRFAFRIDQPHADYYAPIVHPERHCMLKTLEHHLARCLLLSARHVLWLVLENRAPEQHGSLLGDFAPRSATERPTGGARQYMGAGTYCSQCAARGADR